MVVQQIKSRLQLSNYVQRYVRLTNKGHGRYVGLCPFHGEKSPSFSVDDTRGLYYCFGCHKHGDLLKFAQEITGQGFQDCVKQLAKECGIEVKQSSDNVLYRILSGFVDLAHENLLQNKTAQEYLFSRGLTADTILRYKLGYVGQELVARFVNVKLGINYKLIGRILFPIKSSSKIVGFGARALDDTMPKYINSPESEIFSKKHLLYGQEVDQRAPKASATQDDGLSPSLLQHYRDYLSKTVQRTATEELLDSAVLDTNLQKKEVSVLVEGYMDVLLINQNTPYQAWAALGTAVSSHQLEKLLTRPLVLCFDGDEAGSKACVRAAKLVLELFQPGMMVQVYKMPKGSDPADLALSNPERFLPEEGIPLSQFIFELVFDKMSPSPEQLLQQQQQLKEWLSLINNPQARKIFAQHWRQNWQKLHVEPAKAKFTKGRHNGKPVPTHAPKVDFDAKAYLLAMLVQNYDLVEQVQEELANLQLPGDLDQLRLGLLENNYRDLPLAERYQETLLPNTDLSTWLQMYNDLLKADYNLQLSTLQKELVENFSEEVWDKIQKLLLLRKGSE